MIDEEKEQRYNDAAQLKKMTECAVITGCYRQ